MRLRDGAARIGLARSINPETLLSCTGRPPYRGRAVGGGGLDSAFDTENPSTPSLLYMASPMSRSWPCCTRTNTLLL